MSGADAVAREVTVRELGGLDEQRAACALLDAVWGGGPVLPLDVLRALTLAGNYAAGAYAQDALVGVCVGFFGAPEHAALHSHVTGVAAGARGLGVGRALKLHQRRWALAHGVGRVTWTFDPLVRRNAHLNLARLGATAQRYLPEFYGALDDALNAGAAADRLLVSWELESAAVVRALGGEPVAPATALAEVALGVDAAGGPERGPTQGEVLLVHPPPDIEALRARDPERAAAWSTAMREVLGGLLDAGARVAGFAAGAYVVEKR